MICLMEAKTVPGYLVDAQAQFTQLSSLLSLVSLKVNDDQLVWKLNGNRIFSGTSMYQFLNTRGHKCSLAANLWNLFVPLKVASFLWLCWKKKLNTRDLLGKKFGKNFGGCIF